MADVAHEERPLDSEPAGKKVLDTASKSAPRCPNFEDKDQQQQQDNQSDPESPQNYYTLDGERNGEDVDNATSKLKEVDPKPLNGKFDTVDGVEDNLPEGSEVPDGDEVKDVQDKATVADGEVPEGSVTSNLSMAQRAKQAFSAISGSKPASVVPEDDVAKDVEVPDTETGVEEDDIPKDAEVPSTDVGVTGDDLPKDAEVPETTDAPIELKNDEEAIPTGEEKDAKDEEAKPEEAAEEEEEEGEKIDYSILKNAKVNKGGNLVDSDNKIVGRVREGILVHLVGKRADENGDIWNDGGKVIGKAEPIPDNEREALLKEPAPFESFPDAVVDGDGKVTSGGQIIGTVIEGDVKVLQGKSVDPDGDILDRGGNVIGKAKRLEAEPEPEPEPEVDRSVLGGKRVNKAGNVVDKSGAIFGRVVEGDPKSMVGRMCDKKGNILNEMGDVIGRAEVVLEAERDGLKEGPFAELIGCTVTKEGKVVTPGGDVVGRLVSGDPKVLYGRSVDEDGDVCDKNGNVLGKAERWEEPVVEKKKSPLSGRRVNREGNVVDEDGNLIAKLTTGTLNICSGMEIDDDGDVVNSKGVTIGHVSLLEDIPEPEPEPEVGESPEEKEKREQVEKDRKLAQQMSVCIEQCLDKVKPICTMITDKIQRAERTPKEELDEEQLVKDVKPLIEEGGKILTEANGVIRGLDPDGRIVANAKHKTATREATNEEFHLADVLKELTGTVTQTIENAKRMIEDMPHAKKELNPLWGLLNEPLFQILAAVGLLLNGVLSLVGRLLDGLGLGGLLDGLLGTLGLNRLLEGLGLGSVTDALTGGGKKK